MTKPPLSNIEIRALKSQAHALKPVVRIGQHGVTDAVLTELDNALTHHELLKVKLSSADRDDRDELIKKLAEKSKAVIIQRIGGVVVLYRKKPAASADGKSRKPQSRAGATKGRTGATQNRARSTKR